MLLELAKGEGWGNMRDTKFNGKACEVNGEFAASLPEAGTFEGTYVCPPEKVKMDLR